MIGAIGYDVPKLAGVMEGSSAEEEGLAAGDTILALDGYRVHFYQEISVYSFFHPGKTMDVTYERDGKEYSVQVTPRLGSSRRSAIPMTSLYLPGLFMLP